MALSFGLVAGALGLGPAGFAGIERQAHAAAGGAKKPKDPKLAQAAKRFDEGKAAYEKGRYEEAIQAWEEAYELSRKPLLFESIANAHERLGDYDKAREYLAKWREAAPAGEHALLDERLGVLDERIRKKKEEEAARLEAERLRNQPPPPPPPPPPPASGVSVPGLAILLGGVGLGLVGVGIDVAAGLTRPDPSKACAASGGKTICLASERGAIDLGNNLAITGDVFWIAGAAVAVAGAVYLGVDRPKPSASTARVRVLPLVSVAAVGTRTAPLGGLMVGGSF